MTSAIIDRRSLIELRNKAAGHDDFLTAMKAWQQRYYSYSNLYGSESPFVKGYAKALEDLGSLIVDAQTQRFEDFGPPEEPPPPPEHVDDLPF